MSTSTVGVEGRAERFRRNLELEAILSEINDELWVAESAILLEQKPQFPLIFLVGPLRSGTTLLMQWLANMGCFAYPSNMLSRFYKAPILGAKIQLLLTDKRYNFRNEIIDFNSGVDFVSENGKTSGALSPNEFWYFWRRFLPFGELDYLPTAELKAKVDSKTFIAELAGVSAVYERPLVMKAMILNHNIDFLSNLFDNAIFIQTRRDPLANIASALDARQRQYGNVDQWYSFKLPQYPQLVSRSPHEQVAGQIYYINRDVDEGMRSVPEQRRLIVDYEGFCANPESYYHQLRFRLAELGYEIPGTYSGPQAFEVTREKVGDPQITEAWAKFDSGVE